MCKEGVCVSLGLGGRDADAGSEEEPELMDASELAGEPFLL